MLLTFWREPVPVGISSTTTSHVDTQSLRYRHTTIQLVASVTLHASLYPTTSLEAFKATYAEPMLPFEVEGLEPRGDNVCRAPLFKNARGRPQTTRLTADEQRGPGGCMERGSTKISLAGYSTALAVIKRATMYSAVQPFRLASRSVLLHEGPTSLSGERRQERCGETTRFTHLQLIKAAFVAVLETRSVGSTWLQRERERYSNCGLSLKYINKN